MEPFKHKTSFFCKEHKRAVEHRHKLNMDKTAAAAAKQSSLGDGPTMDVEGPTQEGVSWTAPRGLSSVRLGMLLGSAVPTKKGQCNRMIKQLELYASAIEGLSLPNEEEIMTPVKKRITEVTLKLRTFSASGGKMQRGRRGTKPRTRKIITSKPGSFSATGGKTRRGRRGIQSRTRKVRAKATAPALKLLHTSDPSVDIVSSQALIVKLERAHRVIDSWEYDSSYNTSVKQIHNNFNNYRKALDDQYASARGYILAHRERFNTYDTEELALVMNSVTGTPTPPKRVDFIGSEVFEHLIPVARDGIVEIAQSWINILWSSSVTSMISTSVIRSMLLSDDISIRVVGGKRTKLPPMTLMIIAYIKAHILKGRPRQDAINMCRDAEISNDTMSNISLALGMANSMIGSRMRDSLTQAFINRLVEGRAENVRTARLLIRDGADVARHMNIIRLLVEFAQVITIFCDVISTTEFDDINIEQLVIVTSFAVSYSELVRTVGSNDTVPPKIVTDNDMRSEAMAALGRLRHTEIQCKYSDDSGSPGYNKPGYFWTSSEECMALGLNHMFGSMYNHAVSSGKYDTLGKAITGVMRTIKQDMKLIMLDDDRQSYLASLPTAFSYMVFGGKLHVVDSVYISTVPMSCSKFTTFINSTAVNRDVVLDTITRKEFSGQNIEQIPTFVRETITDKSSGMLSGQNAFAKILSHGNDYGFITVDTSYKSSTAPSSALAVNFIMELIAVDGSTSEALSFIREDSVDAVANVRVIRIQGQNLQTVCIGEGRLVVDYSRVYTNDDGMRYKEASAHQERQILEVVHNGILFTHDSDEGFWVLNCTSEFYENELSNRMMHATNGNGIRTPTNDASNGNGSTNTSARDCNKSSTSEGNGGETSSDDDEGGGTSNIVMGSSRSSTNDSIVSGGKKLTRGQVFSLTGQTYDPGGMKREWFITQNKIESWVCLAAAQT